MRRTLLLMALLLIAAQTRAQETAEWTLERCVSEAFVQSPRLVAAQQSLRAAEAAAREAGALRWPTLGVNGSYAYASEVQELAIPLAIPGFAPPRIQFGDGNVYDFALTVRTPLYSGGAPFERAKADASAFRAARHDLAGDSLRLLYDVRRAFFNALGAESRLAAARQSAERLARYVAERTRSRDLGAATEEGVVLSTARLRQAESAVLAAEAELEAARLVVGSLVAESGQPVTPAGNLETPLMEGEVDAEGYAARPEVTALAARIEQSRYLTRAARGAYWPSLSGNAAWHYAKPGVDVIQNEWMDYYTLGVSANWTLWDWNARAGRVGQARASMRALEARKKDLLDGLATRFASSAAAVRAARAATDKLRERADLEQRRLAMVENRLRSGMATETEFLDAQDDLTAAQTELAAALSRLRLAEADLLYAAGR